MTTSYRSFLTAPGAPRLLASGILARLPLGISSLAILLLFREHSGSFGLAGVAVGAYSLSSAAAAPVQGALVDRLGPSRVLLPCAVGQAGLFVAVVQAAHEGVAAAALVPVAAAAGVLLPPVSACARSLWPRLDTGQAGLEAAYAVDAITQEVIWISGPLLVALMVRLESPAAALLLSASLTVAGTALFASSPLTRGAPRGGTRRSRAGPLASGPLRVLLGSIVLTGLSWGAISVGLTAVGVHAGSRQSAGVLLALLGVGSVLGGLGYGARGWGRPYGSRYRALFLLLAACVAPLVAIHSLPAAYVLALLAGFCWAPLLSCQYTLVGRAAPAGSVTEAFTWMVAAFAVGVAVGSALAGGLVDAAGIGAPFALVCACGCLAAAVTVAGRRLIEQLSPVPAL